MTEERAKTATAKESAAPVRPATRAAEGAIEIEAPIEAVWKALTYARELERAGFVELHEARRKGNCVERVMRAKARHWLIDPGALAGLADAPMPPADRFSAAYLISLAARAIREVAGLVRKAADSRKRLATLAIESDVRLGHPSDFPAFADDLARAIADVIARHHDDDTPGGRRFRILAGAWPGKERKRSLNPTEER